MAAAVGAALWMLAQPWTLVTARGDGRLHITFLDVGQGDSAFIRLPRGGTLLIDTGGLVGRPSTASIAANPSGPTGFDIGDRVVAPPLRIAGVRRLDYLVLTHGDPDHIGGAGSILREFRPRHVWEGIPVAAFAPLVALHGVAQSLGLHWANVSTGEHMAVEDVDITVRHPDPPTGNASASAATTRWLWMSLAGPLVLLTGDIGKDVERALARRIQPSPLTVVKVPHHGSLTSSTTEFIRALRPRIAVVSVGRANRFGHPVPEVLARYREAGAEVFRTDRDGAVTIDSDGYSIDVHTFTGRQRSWFTTSSHHEATKDTKP
jgi:competence protein ComEC